MTRIAIFKPGKHRPDAPNITAADAQHIADSYDKKKHHAPLVIGHPASHDRAYGWVDSLSFKDGTLYANLKQVNEKFAKIVRDGAYKYLSAAFYRPNASANPAKGESYYLRHLGCLGAVPPAVKGLPALAFGEGEDENDFVSIDFEDAGGGEVINLKASMKDMDERNSDEFEQLKNRLDQLEANNMNKDKSTKSANTGSDDVSLAEREAAASKLEAELNQRKAELDKREEEQARQGHSDFVEKLHKAGVVLPRHKDGMIDFMCGLDADQVINFTSADSKTGKPADGSALEFLKDFLEALPPSINYEEVAKAEEPGGGNVVNFSVPAGVQVDGKNLDLDKKARGLMAKNSKLSYEQAVLQVAGG